MKYFKKEEFECKCGCGALPEQGIMVAANLIRYAVGEPLRITSGKRCEKHNANVGGSKNSKHLSGEAIDIQFVKNNSKERIKKLRNILKSLFKDECGIGKYSNFVHFDIRKNKARW